MAINEYILYLKLIFVFYVQRILIFSEIYQSYIVDHLNLMRFKMLCLTLQQVYIYVSCKKIF